MPLCPGERSSQPGEKRQGRDRVDRREERSEILADLDQKRRHMSERVFYPDTDEVSSTSKVVALSIARNRTRERSFRFALSCHAIALASAEALYERRIKREAKLAQFLLLN